VSCRTRTPCITRSASRARAASQPLREQSAGIVEQTLVGFEQDDFCRRRGADRGMARAGVLGRSRGSRFKSPRSGRHKAGPAEVTSVGLQEVAVATARPDATRTGTRPDLGTYSSAVIVRHPSMSAPSPAWSARARCSAERRCGRGESPRVHERRHTQCSRQEVRPARTGRRRHGRAGVALVAREALCWWELPWWGRRFPSALVTSCSVPRDGREELDHCRGEFSGALDVAKVPCPIKDREL
jgi:hypothetical protein